MTEVVKTRTNVVCTLSAPAGRRGSGGLGGTSSITLYETESIHMKQHIWGQHNALNLNETLSYPPFGQLLRRSLWSQWLFHSNSIIMYDLESAYIWDDKKRLGKKVIIPYQECFHISLLHLNMWLTDELTCPSVFTWGSSPDTLSVWAHFPWESGCRKTTSCRFILIYL